MFGYVTVDLPNVYVKDVTLYKATYCGLCKSIGEVAGEKGRFFLNYDLTFLSAFLHNVKGVDLSVNKEHCVLHRIRKRPVAKPDDLSRRIGALNVIFAYLKILDDVKDEGKHKGLKSFFKSSYKKAKAKEPVLDKIVKNRFSELMEKEKKNCSVIDEVADSFGTLMSEVVNELLDGLAEESVKSVSYELGKWIYLIDALDDFDFDKKKKNYNVFINAFPDIKSKEELIKEKGDTLYEIFGFILSKIVEENKKIKYNFNHDLTDNILERGLFIRTKNIMENKKCKNVIKF